VAQSSRSFYRVLVAAAFVSTSPIAFADGASGSGVVSIPDGNPILQDFNTLSNSSSPSNLLPPGWYLTEMGTGAAADGRYVVDTGASNGGGAYSFGAAGSTDRALGSIGSGSVTPIYYGARFVNNTTGVVTALFITYDGEMWRRGTSSADGLAFSYSTTAAVLNSGTYVSVTTLNFPSPVNCSSTTSTATIGNSGNCKVGISGAITGLTLVPGNSIWLRWMDIDSAGSDDGLAIDNVSVTATISFTPTPPSATGSVTPSPAAPGQPVSLDGTITPGFNPLSQSYTVTCDLSSIGGSIAQALPVSGTTFTYNAAVPAGAVPAPYTLPCSIQDDQSRLSSFALSFLVLNPLDSACGHAATPISAIQGSGLTSPLVGQVVDAEAIVTGNFQGSSRLSGFYMQSAPAEDDGNPATSEGLFVFSSSPANSGDRVRVRGKIAEYSSATGSLVSNLTELGSVSSVQVCTSGNSLPAPVDVTLPIGSTSGWERYEGMLVRFNQPLMVTGNYNLGQYGQIDLAPGVLYQPTQTPANTVVWSAAADLNSRSIIALDDGSNQSGVSLNGGTVAPYPPPGLSNANTLRVGALVNPNGDRPPLPLIGVLDDRFGTYRIQPVPFSPVTFSNTPNPRPDIASVSTAVGGRFKIVSANVLNFFTTLGSRGAQTADELNHQRTKIVAALAKTGGDVIGLSELQNFANGQTNGATYTNDAITDLTSALAAATGRNYRFLNTIDSANLVPGNVVGDNGTDAIRCGILYNADSVVPVGQAALYNQNDQNRPTLAQTFQPNGGIHPEQQTFTVVVNHFRSRGSTCGPGSDDVFQGNCNGMRLSMAHNVRNWLANNPSGDPAGADRKYILIGDFNAYLGEDPIQAFLASGGYTNLIQLLVGPAGYSYNFGSQAGYIDHSLVNDEALPLVKSVAELHIDADEPPALRALNTSSESPDAQAAYYAPNEFASADHDPIVIGFNPLLGDFTDDGVLDAQDRTALLRARGQSGSQMVDRRMDMDHDGTITQNDFLIWQKIFIAWQQGRK
jgi:uncharacterized protein